MSIGLLYGHTRSVAQGVFDELKARGIEPLMLFPYNRFVDKDRSVWWVNPSKENPAYKHGKYAFDPDLSGRGDFFCGIHVEKGFGPATEMMMTSPKAKRLLMRDDWMWHQFVADLAGGKVDSRVREIVEATGNSANIFLQAHYCDVGGDEFDPYDTDEDCDFLEFAGRGGGIALEEGGSTPKGLLESSRRAATLQELGKAMMTIPKHEWVWVNFWLGQEFVLDPERRKRTRWSAEKLYNGVLKPLRTWFA
jgi:hypothetical protein